MGTKKGGPGARSRTAGLRSTAMRSARNESRNSVVPCAFATSMRQSVFASIDAVEVADHLAARARRLGQGRVVTGKLDALRVGRCRFTVVVDVKIVARHWGLALEAFRLQTADQAARSNPLRDSPVSGSDRVRAAGSRTRAKSNQPDRGVDPQAARERRARRGGHRHDRAVAVHARATRRGYVHRARGRAAVALLPRRRWFPVPCEDHRGRQTPDPVLPCAGRHSRPAEPASACQRP